MLSSEPGPRAARDLAPVAATQGDLLSSRTRRPEAGAGHWVSGNPHAQHSTD